MPSWLKVLALKSFSLLLIFIFFHVFFAFPVSADWPLYKYDFERSGLSPYGLAQKPELKWTSPDITTVTQPPTVDSDQNLYVPTNTKLAKLSPTGTLLWSFNTYPPTSGPTFDLNNNLYFATSGCNSFVYSLNPDGTQRWNYNLQGQGLCGDNAASTPIAISRDKTTIYVGVSRPFYGIIAFDLNGNIKFKKQFSFEIPQGIAIDKNNNLIVTTTNFLFSLSPTGTTNWGFRTIGVQQGLGTPAIGPDDNIYFTTGSGTVNSNSLISYTLTGQGRYTHTVTNTFRLTNPAIKGTVVYFTENNSLHAINSTNGTLLWKWTSPTLIPDQVASSPIVDKNGIIYTTLKDTIYAISPDGTLNWQLPLTPTLGQLVLPKEETLYVTRQEGFKGFLIALDNSTPTKTPVLFIPGIGGSELKVVEDTNWSAPDGHGGIYPRNYNAGEKVWVNEAEARALGNDDYFDILRLKSDGQTDEAPLQITGDLFAGAYQPTIDFFNTNGYVMNQDFFIFPYDWRKDIALTKDLLDQKIENIKQQTNTSKVDIVAHSMGGLVARNYISDPTKASSVNKLITLGTPHLGSVKFLKALGYGVCLTKEGIPTQPICIGLSASENKDVIQNMIGGFELSPSEKYFQVYYGIDNEHPLPFLDDRDIDNNGIRGPLNYLQIKELFTNLGHNTPLFTQAENFHDLDNDLVNTNGVEATLIAGSGINTLGQIIEKYKFDFLGIKIPEKDEIKINGDDTVPLFSASLYDPSQNLSLKGNAKVYYTKQNHGALPSNGAAMNLVKNILNDDPAIPTGVSTQPFQLNGKQLSVHSPVNIHAYDSLGNHTGPLPNGDFEANIPGSSYDTLDDAKFIFLPDDGIYEIKFEATDQGSFDFKIRNYSNDTNDELILYKDIPLTQNTEAETILDTQSPLTPQLSLDQNGDGEIDLQLNANSTITGNEISDNTPPQTNINVKGDLGSQDWYKSDVTIELNPTDDSSGIMKTEYSIDDDELVKTYFEQIVLSEGTHKLEVKSTDNAGNEEEIQILEIKIDKTPPEVKIQFKVETQNFDILGIDNSNTEISETQPGQITIVDEAGNTTKLSVEPKDKKRKEKLVIKSISYNDLQNILPENKFEVNFKLEKNTNQIIDLDQKIVIKGEEKLTTNYNPNKNITTITNKQPGAKTQKEEVNGMITLFITTRQGELQTTY